MTSLRHSLLALLALLLVASASAAQGPGFSHKQGETLNAVFFLDDLHGWTAEDGARVRYTVDGGSTWKYGFTPPTFREELGDIVFLDTQNGWTVSFAGSVLRSFDGGETWVKVNNSTLLDVTGAPAQLNSIFMFDDSLTGWAVGDDGALYRTFNGGGDWTKHPNPPAGFDPGNSDPEDPYKIHFFSSNWGILAADYDHLYTTVNGGADWDLVDLTPQAIACGLSHNLELWDFDFADGSTHGVLGGGVGVNTGVLLRTENGGFTWTIDSCFADALTPGDCHPPTVYGVTRVGAWPGAMASGYDSLLFGNEPAAAAVHESCSCSAPGAGSCAAVWVRKDVPSDFSPPLFGIDQIGSTSRIAAAGMFGILRLFDTATGQLTDKGSEHGLRLESGAFLEDGIGCVAGQSFAIYRTTDSGDTFQQVLPAPPALPDVFAGWIRDIEFSSSGVNGVAVGDTGFTAWSNNAGETWALAPQGSFNLQCVAFVPATTHVLAAGVNGALRRSTNFGVSWSGVPSPTTETILAMTFVDSQVGYMVGTHEAIFRTDDGGLTWSPVEAVDTDGISTDFHGVAAWSDGAIAVGSGGRVYESAGGRFHHVDLSSLGMTVSTLTDVQAFEVEGTVHVRACGTEGVMLFRDGGTWSLPKSQTSGIHVAVSFLEPDLGYGIGREFLVTKYE